MKIWREYVEQSLKNLGVEAHLSIIYTAKLYSYKIR